MPNHKYAVLLAGGQGSRFWPQSRTLEPKQFLSLCRKNTFFEETLSRVKSLIRPKNIFIVTSELYRHQISKIIPSFRIPSGNVIFEPEPKNTAPSVGIAIRLISLSDPHATVCVLPCDHMIRNKAQFIRLLDKATKSCGDNLVIFGIPPERAATGYGYIKIVLRQKATISKDMCRVEKFIEKPGLKVAQRFLKNGGYFWNSGIFVGSCQRFSEEIKNHLPRLNKELNKIKTLQDINLIWDRVSPVSFDYGVLEKSRHLLMLAAKNLGWSDLGSWQAWDSCLTKDKQGNAIKADVVNLGSENITVLGKGRVIAAIGLKDLIIIDTADALLITKKDKSEEVKRVVEILKQNRRSEHF